VFPRLCLISLVVDLFGDFATKREHVILASAIAMARAYAAEHQMVVVDCLEELDCDSNADKRQTFVVFFQWKQQQPNRPTSCVISSISTGSR